MITLHTLTLPPGLLWSDEFAPAPVAQTTRRTLGGNIVITYAGTSGGMPITLESESDAGWWTRAQVIACAALAASPGAVYTLSLRGTTYQVMFRHHEPPAFEPKPIINLANPTEGAFYTATLKLITIV